MVESQLIHTNTREYTENSTAAKQKKSSLLIRLEQVNMSHKKGKVIENVWESFTMTNTVAQSDQGNQERCYFSFLSS